MEVSVKPHQHSVLTSQERLQVLLWSRRSGKSFVSALWLLLKQTHRGGMVFYIAPSFQQCKDFFLTELLPLVEATYGIHKLPVSLSELSIKFPSGEIRCVSGSDGAGRIRGKSLTACVIDEAQDITTDAYNYSILPALADQKGDMLVSGTASPQGLLHDLWHNYKGEPFCSLVRAHEAGIIEPDELSRMKSSKDAMAYAQEFNCEFINTVSYTHLTLPTIYSV